MSLKVRRPMILDFIGWNLVVLAFMCFVYVATVEKGVDMATIVPIAMIIGCGFIAWAMGNLKTDRSLGGKELYDGLLWFMVSFGAIVTLNIGVVNLLSHPPFGVTFAVMTMALYGVLIAIAEELFRAFWLTWGATLTPLFGPYIAVPVSAGAWTVFHFAVYGTNPLALIMVFMVGIILGFVMWYKQRLWIAMGAHALVNLLAWSVGTWLATFIPIILITVLVVLWVYSRGRKR